MVKLNKIYTKTGDSGQTGLVTGPRVAKTSARIEAIGAVDELNASIGMARHQIPIDTPVADELRLIQNDLFDMGADLATPEHIDGALRLLATQVTHLERFIDTHNANIPPLTSFVLPAGDGATAALHFARAIARRAERRVWAVVSESAPTASIPAVYLNRLSDYLFVVARLTAKASGGDVLWQPGANQ